MDNKQVIQKLLLIGKKMSAENDVDKLLQLILEEISDITSAYAGTISILEEIDDKKYLSYKYRKFHGKISKNEELRFEVDDSSIIGNSFLNKKVYKFNNMDEVYETLGFHYDRSFDSDVNKYSHNMLSVPVVNYNHEVVGVLLLINKIIDGTPVPFTDEDVEIVLSLTSQAATLIDRTELFDEVELLVNSFIETLVSSLEQRDPITSGHSKRVADLSIKLLNYINDKKVGPFREFRVSDDETREIYYSAMLHDIGKIGVSEAILMKTNKLTDEEIKIIELRFELIKNYMKSAELNNELMSNIDFYLNEVKRVNELNYMTPEELETITNLYGMQIEGCKYELLTNYEYEKLSVRKGNLTIEERDRVQMHAKYSYDILSKIHWSANFSDIPCIASLHHEKLDGSGYPLRLSGDEIPMGSQIIGIVDIFDALTTTDRPYKSAMEQSVTFSILRKDVEKGRLDADLVSEFIEMMSN